MAVAYWRPIELTSSNNTVNIGVGGGVPTLTLTKGVYANIWSLLYELLDKFNDEAGHGAADIQLNTSNKVVMSSGAAFDLTFGSSTLDEILGFDGDKSGASTYTADYTPSHCWFPTYQPYDGTRFATKQDNVFYGAVAVDGSISGVAAGDVLLERTFRFSTETSTNVFEEPDTTDTDNWLAKRCFEYFVEKSRTASLSGTVADHSNCSPKGAYYIHDLSDWQSITVTNVTWDKGGNKFYLGTGADTFLFCNVPVNGTSLPPLTNSKTQDYYDISLKMTSSAVPSGGWSAS
jgi:hypothetical protein